MVTEVQVSTAALAAINASLPLSVRAYSPSKVPATRPNEFVVVAVVRRAGGAPRAGRHATTGWSAYVTAASRTSDGNASTSLDKASEALENVPLDVAGIKSTPPEFAGGREVGPDDGWFSGTRQYQFAL